MFTNFLTGGHRAAATSMRGQNVGKIDAWAKIIAPWAEKKATRAKIVGEITTVRGQNHEMRGQNH